MSDDEFWYLNASSKLDDWRKWARRMCLRVTGNSQKDASDEEVRRLLTRVIEKNREELQP